MADDVDYRYDPEAYELEERSRPDEMLMLEEASAVAATWLDARADAHALDLCCGTGLSMRSFAEHPNVSTVTGVDNCIQYLDYARRQFRLSRIKPSFILADAATVTDEQLGRPTWDVIMLASAYHHIEDARKLIFLRRVRTLLGVGGKAIMAENVLPHYTEGDAVGYRRSVERFYWEVLRTARRDNPRLPLYVEQLIEKVAQYGYDGDYEYKVCMSILVRHLAEAGLQIAATKRVWPTDDTLDANAGNFVFLLQPTHIGEAP